LLLLLLLLFAAQDSVSASGQHWGTILQGTAAAHGWQLC
jgi:hypothetical protein